MRLQEISVRNCPPVRLFSVTELSDVVVIAGPNGVGKTRLLERILAHLRGAQPTPDIQGGIAATSREETEVWGKDSLDMSSPEDMEHLRSTLQRSRRRQNWTSSLLVFESDRSIRNLQPLQFSWDMPDPFQEEVGWDFTFNWMHDRFQDTVHSMFRMIEHQKQSIASRAITLRRQGREEMKLNFTDPMEPFKEVFSQLLAPKELVDPLPSQQRLQYREDGMEFDVLSGLSSGEKEVVNIAFDFLLRGPQDCIILFDEPELHLHPELSYRLILTLQQIGKNNQFVFSTHSPDIITASLDRSVVFISPPSQTPSGEPANQAVPVSEDDETNQALKLLGHSIGIIALGKKIVLIEGSNSSLDKQTYGSIIRNRFPGLVLVPSGNKHVIRSFAAVHETVLSKSIWGVEFFMLCDHDSSPEAPATAGPEGRLQLLSRYHVENYFLDEHVWELAFAVMEPEDSWLRSRSEIRRVLRELAGDVVSYATALKIASRLRQEVGNADLMVRDCHGKSFDELARLLKERIETEQQRLDRALNSDAAVAEAHAYFQEVSASLESDTDDWKVLVPGKPLLGKFAGMARVTPARARTMYIAAAARSDLDPFAEILAVFELFENWSLA